MKQLLVPALALLVQLAAACGSVEAGAGPGADAPDGGDVDHRADGGAVDPDAPTVLSVSPADGTGGVAPDAHITVVFSQPMDADAVVAAWRSEDLPAGAVSFSWNETGDTLTVAPDDPLPVAEGSADNPDAIEPLTIAFVIGGEARDAAGVPLDEPLEVAFRTVRRLSLVLPYDASLSGSRIDTGSVDESPTTVYAGDSIGDKQIRLVVSFALPAPLPGAIVESATFSATQTDSSPGVYGAFGDLGLVHVRYATIATAYGTAALGRTNIFSTSGANGNRSAVVTGAVADDLEDEQPYAQFRLQFPVASNNDGEYDIAQFTRAGLRLSISYLAE
ncbi:MAG TPA: Ig-like domain-containing protein [Kofleriaceae bacterium]|jgi:hypothetical protein